jgi:hypothetical protein
MGCKKIIFVSQKITHLATQYLRGHKRHYIPVGKYCLKSVACGVSRSERMGVLDRGVPGTLEAGEGTGELVCEEDVSEAELLPEIYRKRKC